VSQKIDFNVRVAVVAFSAFLLFVLIVYVGVSLGVPEDQRATLVGVGLIVSLPFAVFTWKTFLSLIGLISFAISLWAGGFAGLAPEVTLVIAVSACLGTGFSIVIARAFRE